MKHILETAGKVLGWILFFPSQSHKISFGGIPNSSSIDILMPYAIFDYTGAFLRSGFAHVDNVIPVIKTITWLLLSRLQGNKFKPHRNSPEPSEPTPTRAGTLQNPPAPTFGNFPEPTSGTYASIHRPSEIFRNLPELASGTYTILHRTLRNLPEPAASGT